MPSELSVGVEAIDRAGLGEQLRRGQRAATGQLEQSGRGLRGPLFELAVELRDDAVERATAADEVARERTCSGCSWRASQRLTRSRCDARPSIRSGTAKLGSS